MNTKIIHLHDKSKLASPVPNQISESSLFLVEPISNTKSDDPNVNHIIKEYIKDPNARFVIEFSAGALGGAVSRTVTAPIDRLKTIFQVNSVDMKSSELNIMKMCSYMLKEGKWQGLWRGNLVNVLKTAPENAIRLATYEKFKHLLNENKEKTFKEKLACGSAAGFVSTLILYPLKTVKTIMNLGKTGEFKSIADCINKIYEVHGLKAFYRGLVANSIAIIPATGVDLAVYETLKKKYALYQEKNEVNFAEKIAIGCFSSSIGNFFVYPLILARTRLQSNRDPSETTIKLLKYILKRDGLAGLYRGFFLHILKIGPAAGISYYTFEAVTKEFSLNSLN